MPNQDLSHARSNIKGGEFGVCQITSKWRTDASDLPNLTMSLKQTFAWC